MYYKCFSILFVCIFIYTLLPFLLPPPLTFPSGFYYYFQAVYDFFAILDDALRGGTAAGFAVKDSQIDGCNPFGSDGRKLGLVGFFMASVIITCRFEQW
jgi:hypothetical protein